METPEILTVIHGPMFVCLLIGEKRFLQNMLGLQRLSVCHTIFGQSFQAIVLNFCGYVVDRPKTATLNFGEDPNPDLDLRIFISRRAQSAKREI